MTLAQHRASLVCNCATVVFVVYAFVEMITSEVGILSFRGTDCLILFTVDSNLLAALSCLVVALCNISALRRGARAGAGAGSGASAGSGTDAGAKAKNAALDLPHAALVFKFVGTVAVTLTFLTVVCFLGPTLGYLVMFAGSNFWFHLVCPLLCIVSLSCFERGVVTVPESLIGLVPVVIYGAWYLVMVVAIGADNGGWTDWYGFNRGGMWPVTVVIMAIATAAICLVLRLPHRAWRS